MVIAFLGFGAAGGGIAELLSAREDYRIKYVCAAEQPEISGPVWTADAEAILADPEVEAVVELTGGIEPALSNVTRALEAGKHVVTDNRHLVSGYYDALRSLALANGVSLRCTAAVGGIGWLNSLERCRRADTIQEISGILNGTTNYILDTMHLSPISFQTAMTRTRDLGYLEKDPASDIDGWDSRNRLVIAANMAFGASLRPEHVLVRGIRGIQRRDIDTFLAHGLCCRLLATAEHYAGSLAAVVEPTLVDQRDIEASVHSNCNLLSFVSRCAGRQSFCGQGAGRYPTAYNVVQDLIDAETARAEGFSETDASIPVDNRTFVRQYYIRTALSDPWLWARTEERWETGIITCRLPAPELHAWAGEARQKDPGLFFAALR